jgi:hypothetical protein
LGADDSYPAQSYSAYASAPPDDSSTYPVYDQQQQIDRVNAEVAQLRAEFVLGSHANTEPQPPATQIPVATVFVFRNHRSEEIQNYAIVGKTLWVFTEQGTRKIPIAELDVPATTKANEVRGIDFRLPT